MTKRKQADGVNKSSLLVFIKNPIKGVVKTRLASSVGDEEALRIYLELLNHTRQASSSLAIRKKVYYSHHIEKDDAWAQLDFEQCIQTKGDLGQRMFNAFKESFEDAEKVVIIGSDCPKINPEIINQAFEALDKTNTVIGPTYDGGYYLLGMNQLYPTLFEEINWSTDQVFQQTITKTKSLNINTTILPTLPDIDYIEDWNKYGW